MSKIFTFGLTFESCWINLSISFTCKIFKFFHKNSILLVFPGFPELLTLFYETMDHTLLNQPCLGPESLGFPLVVYPKTTRKRAIFSKCSKADYRGMKLLMTMKPIKSKSWCSNCSKNTKIECVGSTSGLESPVKVRWPKREIAQKKVFSANQRPGKTYAFWRKSFIIIHNLEYKNYYHNSSTLIHEYDSWTR